MEDRAALKEGTRLRLGEAEYTIQTCIGRGGNALVYQAYYFDHLQKGLRHFVLLKELFPYERKGLIFREADGSVACAPQARDWFLLHRESFLRGNRMHLQLLSCRDHSDLAGGNLDSFEANGTCYSVLEHGGGTTLKDALESGLFVPTPLSSVHLIQNMLDALAVYHENGLMHLDISPDNILLMPLEKHLDERRRRVLLIDYNSMWSRQELLDAPSLLLSVKEGYSPPELRLQDRNSIGPWTDLYAACAVFRQLWAASRPEEAPATARNKAEAILRKGLRNAPQSRYASAEDLRADLTELSDRLLGLGVTHAALWEQSRAQFLKLVEKNPAYAYLKEDLLFDAPALPEGHVQLIGQGGMGKTTTLLLWWKSGLSAYKAGEPVNVYIPLYRYQPGDVPFIRRMLLERLRFDGRVATVADALKKLDSLLDASSPCPTVRLLLDGLNEAPGDLHPLLQEMMELSRLRGVVLVLASRTPCSGLTWPVLSMPPLPEEAIRKALSNHGLLYPAGRGQQALLSNPMLLSLYVKAAGQEGKSLDAADQGEILRVYIQSLVDKQAALHPQEAGRAAYAARVFLPALARFMGSERTLSPVRLYALLRGQYRQVRGPALRKAFPQFIGQVKGILADARTAEDWFAPLAEDMLIGRLALMMKDEQGQYGFAHPLFQEHFALEAGTVRRKLRSAAVRYAIPRVLACLLAAGALAFGMVKAMPRSYPATSQEQAQVKNALDGLVSMMASLNSQITSTRAALQQWLDKPDDKTLITTLEQCQVGAQAYLPNSGKLDRIETYFDKWPVTVESAPLRALLSAPREYFDWTQAMCSELEAKLMAPGSVYPESDKVVVVKAYMDYIDLYSRWCFDQVMKVIEPLNRAGRGQALDYLRSCPLFFGQIADMRLDPPTQAQREELSLTLESLQSQGAALLSPIHERGLDAASLMQSN